MTFFSLFFTLVWKVFLHYILSGWVILVWFHGVVGLSHNFHVVRVPGSNPGGTIFGFIDDEYCFIEWLGKTNNGVVIVYRAKNFFGWNIFYFY